MLTACGVCPTKPLKADPSAGLTTALVAIPGGIASAILAGLNRKHGHYALMIGAPIAAMLAGRPVPPN
jgi:MFS superfamily sulfate permease-like transporter